MARQVGTRATHGPIPRVRSFPRLGRLCVWGVAAALLILPVCSLPASAQEAETLGADVARAGGRVFIGLKEADAPTGFVRPGRRAISRERVREIVPELEAMGVSVRTNFHLVPVVGARVDRSMLSALRSHPNVEYVEPQTLYRPAVVGDGRASSPGKPATPSRAESVPWGIDTVDASGAWSELGTRGDGVAVGIIDTGGDADHEDLAFQGGYSAVTGTESASDWDDSEPLCDGHGTHVTGTLAARADNGLGVVGVAPEAHLYVLRVFQEIDGECRAWDGDIIEALDWAHLNGIRIVNLSLGADGSPSTSSSRAYRAAAARGMHMFAAAGNSGQSADSHYPAAFPEVVAVAGTDENETTYNLSNHGSVIEVSAPGSFVESTLPGNSYGTKSGTSMSTPHVTGIAALLLARRPQISRAAVRDLLGRGAVDLGSAGWDPDFGEGRVDALGTAEAFTSLSAAPDLVPGEITFPLGRAVVRGDSLEVRFPVTNRGTLESGTGWKVRLHLSSDSLKSADDLFLEEFTPSTGLPAAGSREWTRGPVIPPSSATGEHYLILTVDPDDVVSEGSSGEDNNWVASVNPVEVQGSPPEASFRIDPPSPTTGDTVLFDASDSSDQDGSVVAYRWDFDGDGTIDHQADSATVSHAYAADGSYTVELTVEDGEGLTDTASRSLTVSNRPPTSALSADPVTPDVGEEVVFDGSSSSDPDGSIEEYRWDFDGDGAIDQRSDSARVVHSYGSAGTHAARLTVVDDDGATGSSSTEIEVSGTVPVASFSFSPTLVRTSEPITFDASESSDPDGAISEYRWDFDGDGTIDQRADSATVTHTFDEIATHAVTLTVVDAEGLTDTTSRQVTVNGHPPLSRFSYTPSDPKVGGQVVFDASAASDSDGTIVEYRWDLDGDGTVDRRADSARVVHRYDATGTYSVKLTVVDDDSLTGSSRLDVQVAPANEPPTASFGFSPASPAAGESVRFDASGSSDPDGGIVEYRWDLDGDGSVERAVGGDTVVHVYPTAGERPVRLVVEDGSGATDDTVRRVAVEEGGPGTAVIEAAVAADAVDGVIGDTVTIPLRLNLTATLDSVAGYTLDLGWDPDRLTFRSVEAGGFGGSFTVNTDDVGSGGLAATSARATPAGGPLTTLLRVGVVPPGGLASGSRISFTLDFRELVDAGSEDLLPQLEIGPTDLCVSDAPYGDPTGDGRAGSADAVQVLRHSVGLTLAAGVEIDRADVNGDGAVGTADAVQILRSVVGLALPASSRMGRLGLGACETTSTTSNPSRTAATSDEGD